MRVIRRALLVAVGLWIVEAVGLPVYLAAAEPVTGTATWYATGPGAGHAAAGSELRRTPGSDWRGTTVQVCAERCVVVRLTDWCACPGQRVIDLSDEDFARLAPLSVGVLRVTVSTIHLTLPPTDFVPLATTRPARLTL
jgi:rare lipoprotein A (peptidoglycan hydrolase)